MLNALEVFTTVVVGLMVGVEFSVAFVINPILNALPEDSGVLGRAHGAECSAPSCLSGTSPRSSSPPSGPSPDGTAPARASSSSCGALLILSVVMSLLLLVPINDRGKTWTPENRPEDWKEQQNRWDRFHYVRVAVIIAAFTLLVAALA